MMIKKIGLWTAYILAVGLLIIGAINRSQLKSDQGSTQVIQSENNIDYVQSLGYRGNKIDQFVETHDYSDKVLEEHSWEDVAGIITGFDTRQLIVQIGSGDEIEITGRAWRFALESGYTPNLGNEIVLSGFYENNEYKIASITDSTSGAAIAIRDESGKPLWGGGGNS
jgi:hypothetical protein